MHQSLTRQLGYLALGAVLALALTVGFTTLMVSADTATSTGTTTASYVFDAPMTGDQEVPPVSATTSTSTNGTGTTTATTTGHTRIWFDMVNATGSATTTVSMWKLVHIWNGNDITMAHLHCGLPGQNGPVVADLYMDNASSGIDVHGTLVGTSSITQSDIRATTTGCSMPIRNLHELAAAMNAGIIYSNAHSLQFPTGVARGQMMLTSSSTNSSSTSTPGHGMCANNANGWYDGSHVWHSCQSNGGNGGQTCNTMGTSTNGWSGWYDNGGLWHSCNGNGGNGGNSCSNMATSTNSHDWTGWYDRSGTWHSCEGNGGHGGNNCVGAASTSLGWYDVHGTWHACNGGAGGTTTPPTNPPASNVRGLLDRVFDRIRSINGGGSSTPQVSGKVITDRIFESLNHSFGDMFNI
ncbi:MAG: CHRD domain-containing protein [Candidatus Pacebacteria bacterium]|nr:CHRD domain-containing protein [Candidatus Paceibacterota bacterium]